MAVEAILSSILFVGATLTQFVFWGFVFKRLADFTPLKIKKKDTPFVSVIICARNEAENLQKHLPLFLNQNYRSFEVIVVDDNSTDNTRDVVLHFMAKSHNLRLIECFEKSTPGKKAALAKGIEAARSDYLFFSDADCRPVGDLWLATCVAHLNTTSQIGLGFGPYHRSLGVLNRFIRFEAAYTALQYFSMALRGLPYMGVGRNLCYTRAVYTQSGGFLRHAHIASGDDDLFVNAAANATNTTVILDPNTFVYSEPKNSLKAYFHQKQRHVSTGTKYRGIHQTILGVLSASHLLHYTGAIACLLCGVSWPLVGSAVLIRWGLVLWRWQKILPRLHQQDLLPWIPLLDIMLLFYYAALAPALFWGKRSEWHHD
jgi:biofilm PGA synthesis N-glycosyltransferase PgaC